MCNATRFKSGGKIIIKCSSEERTNHRFKGRDAINKGNILSPDDKKRNIKDKNKCRLSTTAS